MAWLGTTAAKDNHLGWLSTSGVLAEAYEDTGLYWGWGESVFVITICVNRADLPEVMNSGPTRDYPVLMLVVLTERKPPLRGPSKIVQIVGLPEYFSWLERQDIRLAQPETAALWADDIEAYFVDQRARQHRQEQ